MVASRTKSLETWQSSLKLSDSTSQITMIASKYVFKRGHLKDYHLSKHGRSALSNVVNDSDRYLFFVELLYEAMYNEESERSCDDDSSSSSVSQFSSSSVSQSSSSSSYVLQSSPSSSSVSQSSPSSSSVSQSSSSSSCIRSSC
jgi:hypothetical protein